MTTLYKLSEQNGEAAAAQLIAATRATIARIEQVLAGAEAFRIMHPRHRLRLLEEAADSALTELLRTAIPKVKP